MSHQSAHMGLLSVLCYTSWQLPHPKTRSASSWMCGPPSSVTMAGWKQSLTSSSSMRKARSATAPGATAPRSVTIMQTSASRAGSPVTSTRRMTSTSDSATTMRLSTGRSSPLTSGEPPAWLRLCAVSITGSTRSTTSAATPRTTHSSSPMWLRPWASRARQSSPAGLRTLDAAGATTTVSTGGWTSTLCGPTSRTHYGNGGATVTDWHEEGEDAGFSAEVGDWRLEVFPAVDPDNPDRWIWQAGHDHPAGPYLVAREVLHEGYTDSLEDAQARAIKAMQDQEFAWAEMETPSDWRREARLAQEARDQQRRHDHTWVWNGSNYQCQCGATSDNNVEAK